MTKQIVHRVEDGEDRREILCTTYQMRNPFQQFADGVATELDLHCYSQHAQAALLCPEGGKVLDVCCGRGLLIPFLRYQNPNHRPSLYVGVDIHPANAPWKDGADPRRRGGAEKEDGWGFETLFVESNAAEMAEPLREYAPFDLAVYTSSIEHMHPEAQRASLGAIASTLRPGGPLFLSCPVSPPGKDGYDCQYRSHVYEPQEGELFEWLDGAGFDVLRSYGLGTKTRHFREVLKGSALAQANWISERAPRFLTLMMIATLFPECATEKAYLCQRRRP